MKKIYTLLAAAAVVASASAAAPQAHRNLVQQNFKVSPRALNADASLLPAPTTLSRAVEVVEGPQPVYDPVASPLYYSTVQGWISEDSKGNLVGVSSVSEADNPAANTLTATNVSIDGNKAFISSLGAWDIDIEAEYVAATEKYPSYLVIKSGELCDILDADGNPTGEKWCLYVYDTKTGKVEDYFPMFFNTTERYCFWESDIEGEDFTGLDDFYQRLILANGTDPKAPGYKEYFRAFGLSLDAVNSIMQFDVTFPGSSNGGRAGMYTWSQYAVTEDTATKEKTTWIDVFNLFSVFNSMTFAEANFLVDFDTMTATAEDVALANESMPAYTYWLWGMGADGMADDTVFTVDILNQETTAGGELTYMVANGAWIGTLAQPEQAKCTNIIFQTAFALDLEGAGIANVAVADENAPVEFFNLQGVRVANPENGLFIRRQGNTATKVLVK